MVDYKYTDLTRERNYMENNRKYAQFFSVFLTLLIIGGIISGIIVGVGLD